MVKKEKKFIYDDINYIIVNDNINYNYKIVKRDKYISKLGKDYFENILKVKFTYPLEEKEGIWLEFQKKKNIHYNPAHYINSIKFLENNDFIPFINLKNLSYNKIHKNNWERVTESINAIIFQTMLKYVFDYSDINVKKCFTGSVSLNNLMIRFSKNKQLKNCYEIDGEINKKKKYDFIHLSFYKWVKKIKIDAEKNEYNNIIKIIKIILKNLNIGGSIIFYTISIFNRETKNLIHLISSMFEYVFLHKPHVQHHTYHCYIICINFNNKFKKKISDLISKMDTGKEMIEISEKLNFSYYKNEMIIDLYNTKCYKIQKTFLKPKEFNKEDYLVELVNFYSYHIPEYEISEYYINKIYIKKILSFTKKKNLSYNFYNNEMITHCIDNNNELYLLSENFNKIEKDRIFMHDKLFLKPSTKNVLLNLFSSKNILFDTLIINDILYENKTEFKEIFYLLLYLIKKDGHILINIYKTINKKNIFKKNYFNNFLDKNKHLFKIVYKFKILLILRKKNKIFTKLGERSYI